MATNYREAGETFISSSLFGSGMKKMSNAEFCDWLENLGIGLAKGTVKEVYETVRIEHITIAIPFRSTQGAQFTLRNPEVTLGTRMKVLEIRLKEESGSLYVVASGKEIKRLSRNPFNIQTAAGIIQLTL